MLSLLLEDYQNLFNMKNEIKKIKPLVWITFLLLVAMANAFGQTVKHHSYTTYYDAKLGQPDSVHWLLTPAMGACKTKLPRLNKFIADPLIQNTKFNIYYEGSGYDQGHQFDADDASCSTVDESECWYFSNMVPQLPNLNRITWRALENYTRKLASTTTVSVTCGVIGSLGKMVGTEKVKGVIVKHPSNINIPAQCWKRLVYSGGMVEYYVMPNSDTVSRHPFRYYLQYQGRGVVKIK